MTFQYLIALLLKKKAIIGIGIAAALVAVNISTNKTFDEHMHFLVYKLKLK